MQLQDHPEMIQKAINLLVKVVKHNPDLNESAWQCSTAGMIICMSLLGARGSVSIYIQLHSFQININLYLLVYVKHLRACDFY